MAFVVDASVTMAWFLAGEATPYSEGVLDRLEKTGAIAPIVWPLEVANAFLIGERRGRLTAAQTARFVHDLKLLPITVDDGAVAGAWGPILALGRAHNLTAYDAAYLELATRLGVSLATQDARLRAAAGDVGVPLIREG